MYKNTLKIFVAMTVCFTKCIKCELWNKWRREMHKLCSKWLRGGLRVLWGIVKGSNILLHFQERRSGAYRAGLHLHFLRVYHFDYTFSQDCYAKACELRGHIRLRVKSSQCHYGKKLLQRSSVDFWLPMGIRKFWCEYKDMFQELFFS